MHRIGVVGVSWRSGRLEALAALTIPREARAGRLPLLSAEIGVRGLVYLATCNRVEVAFATDGSVPVAVCRRRILAGLTGREPRPGEAEHVLRAWHGEGAAEHILLVAAGLDSARIGESEIAVQVREAVEQSRELGLLAPGLDRVFTQALKVARRVRPVAEGQAGVVSLAEVAIRHVLERVTRTPGRVALVGVSPMTERCARALSLAEVPLLVVNRTVERAAALAAEIGGDACSLTEFRADPPPVEAVIVATGAREPVLACAALERIAARTTSGTPPLVVDFGVPPNVTPEDAAAAGVRRIGMREITDEAALDRERLLHDFGDARAIVDEALTDLRQHAAERLVGPLIAQLRLRYRHTALEGLERLFQHELSGLGECEREAIRAWAETVARRLAHVPSIGLRDLAFAVGPGAVEAFFGSTEPELARELHEAADRAGIAPLERAFDGA